MLANRRNLVFRVSIVINIAVLLYAAMHLSGNNGPVIEWMPVSGEGVDRGTESRYLASNDMRNFSVESSAKSIEEATYQKTTSTLPTTNKTMSSTASIVDIENKILNEGSLEQLTKKDPRDVNQMDENVLTEHTLTKLRTMLNCYDREFLSVTRQRGEFWVLQNYVKADHGPMGCHESVAYTTHAGFEFLDNVPHLVQR